MGILKSASNALQGIANKTGLGIGDIVQPNLSLFGLNIPGVPLVGFRDVFLKSMETWIGAIPLRTQYIMFFDNFPVGLNTSMIKGLEPNSNSQDFDIDRAKRFLTSFPAQKVSGCIFAQGIVIPDDTLETSVAPIMNNRGFIPGRISGQRAQLNELQVEFRETNSSFIDHVIRPWVILSSHAGLVARDEQNEPEKDPKCNITIVQYTRSFQKISQIPRKVWHFYNCVPTSVSQRQLTYDAESMDTYASNWAYSHYGVTDNLYLPLPDLIDKLF
mgnify:CR=1 FL=1